MPPGAVDVGGPGLGGLLGALGQAGRDAADAGDVADGDRGGRDAGGGGAAVAAGRRLVAVGAARARARAAGRGRRLAGRRAAGADGAGCARWTRRRRPSGRWPGRACRATERGSAWSWCGRRGRLGRGRRRRLGARGLAAVVVRRRSRWSRGRGAAGRAGAERLRAGAGPRLGPSPSFRARRRPGPARPGSRSGASRRPRRQRRAGRGHATARTARRWRCSGCPHSACSSWSVRRDSSRLRKMRSSRSTERTMASALRRSSSIWRMLQARAHQHTAADDERDAEQAARDEVRDLLVQVRAVRRAVPAEQDADEAEDDQRHADPLEPLAHVAAAAARTRPVDHGGQALQAGRHRGRAVGLRLGARARPARAARRPVPASPLRSGLALTGAPRPGSGSCDDLPKMVHAAGTSEVGQFVRRGVETLHERVPVRTGGAEQRRSASSARL